MKTKLLALIMTVTMVFAMAPLTAGVAFADDENIDAAEVEMTEPEATEVETDYAEPEGLNYDEPETVVPNGTAETVAGPNAKALPEGCVLYVGNKQVTGTTAKGKGWSFEYKKGTGYLTLKKANITTSHYDNNSEASAISANGMKLKITLKGKNKIIPADAYMAIGCAGPLTITGKGSLTAEARVYGIYCQNKVTIKKATVAAKTSSNVSWGMKTSSLALSKAKLTGTGNYRGVFADNITASNSKITANCGNDDKPGIQATDFTLNNSTLKSDGILVTNFTVKNSKVTSKAANQGVGAMNIALIKTSKGKYSTRLDSEVTNPEKPAVYAQGNINARIITPTGGMFVSMAGIFHAVANPDGSITQHAVLVPKKANTLKIKAKTATVKYSLLSAENQTLAVEKVIKFVKKGQGELSYEKSSGNENIMVDVSTGEVFIQSGLKKGTYKVKIKVTASGNDNYKSATKTVKVTIKVK